MTAALTQADITAGLRQLGLQAGDGVMVHSSLKSFGNVEGGPQTVIAALMEVLTSEGTLLLPSFNNGAAFETGPFFGKASETAVQDLGHGYYDSTATPTTNGAIPDCFWRLPGVQRSLDPTHAFAAWGKHARRYTEHHHRTLTMGPQSPLGLLQADGGYGLLLGVGYGSNTFHHVVEMSTGAPCLGQRTEAYPVKLADGRIVEGRTWAWRGGECPITDHTAYAEEMRPFERVAMIGSCRATLFKLQDAYTVIARLLAHGKGELPPCSRCPIRPRIVPQTVPSDWDAANQRPLPDSVAWSY
jgi:aminoglycoside 3-N-acetyltransferase